MNMSKKISFIFVLIFSFILFNNNVYAGKCSDVGDWSLQGDPQKEEACINQVEDGYKCQKSSDSSASGLAGGWTCIRSNTCANGYVLYGDKCIQTNQFNEILNTTCDEVSSKDTCEILRNCKWENNKCSEDYVAENPCSDRNIILALRFIGYLLMVAKVAIPLIIIVVGTIDLFKSVVDKDEKSLVKQAKILGMRIVAGIFVFFIPTIVYALFELSSDLKIVNSDKYKKCVGCVLDAKNCTIPSISSSSDSSNDSQSHESSSNRVHGGDGGSY